MKSLWDQPGPRGKASHQNSSPEHLFSSRPSAERCTNAVLFLPLSLAALPEVGADGAGERRGRRVAGRGLRVGNKQTLGITAPEELNIKPALHTSTSCHQRYQGRFEKVMANF